MSDERRSVERLLRIEPPPAVPEASGTVDGWNSVEDQLGVQLPHHLKEYVMHYGAGRWGDFFGVKSPFEDPDLYNATDYFQCMKKRLALLNDFREQYPRDTAPFNQYPSPEGLLPFGYDDNGGTLCFQVVGKPEAWPIICLDGKLSERFEVFHTTVSGFIADVLERKIFPCTWPPDFFPIPQPVFRPSVKK